MCLVAYFTYPTIKGANGILSLNELEILIDETQEKLVEARKLEEDLFNRTTLLQPPGIDRDMLDEQVRRVLNRVHKRDVVIMLKDRF